MTETASSIARPSRAGSANGPGTQAWLPGMRGWLLSLLALLMFAAVAVTARGSSARQISSAATDTPAIRAALARLPLSFAVNRGQSDPRVKYLSRGRGFSLAVLPDGALLRLVRVPNSKRRPSHGAFSVGNSTATVSTLRMRLLGARPNPVLTGDEPLPGQTNYLRGPDASRRITGVPQYRRVRSRGVYRGIDLVYYGRENQLEYDFVVAPGADPKQIRLSFEGTTGLALTGEGDLVLRAGGSEIRQSRPTIYQVIHGQRRLVAGGYQRNAANQVAFHLGTYDRRYPLVIDPVLAYSTYLGGSGDDTGTGIAVDASGSVYVTGATISADFPIEGAFQDELGAPLVSDAFVMKLSPDGGAVVYSTYLGGLGDDGGSEITLDGSGNAYVTGTTNSNDFPTTAGAFDRVLNGNSDLFVAKLNAAGSRLLYSTYLGGSSSEQAYGIAVDGSGQAYLTGSTQSANFPTTAGAFDRSINGGWDAYVTKLDANGSNLVYSTYLGSNGFDYGSGIAVNSFGEACLTGGTQSANFPTTVGAFDRTFGGNWDAFVTRMETDGSGLVFSTFLGGQIRDEAFGIALDPADNAVVTGETSSTDFPTTEGALDRSWNLGVGDAFVTRVHVDGSRLDYSTYLGGRSEDAGVGVAADRTGKLYVTGFTASTNFPVVDATQQTAGGLFDAFVVKIDPDLAAAASLAYSTYLGGRDNDAGQSIAVDNDGTMSITGEAVSANFPTVTPLQPTNEGATDLFIARISSLEALGKPTGLTATAVSSTRIDLAWRDNSSAEAGFEIQRRKGTSAFATVGTTGANVRSFADSGLTVSTTYTYRVRAVNRRGASAFSNEASATTEAGAPGQPTELTATSVSSAEIRLAWKDNSSNETGFAMERKTGSDSFAEVQRTDPDVTEYLDNGLAADTEYTYRVRAINGGGNSAYSNEAKARTAPAPPTPPAAPDELTASAVSAQRINLAWVDNSNNEKTFEVERKTGAEAFARIVALNAGITSYSDTGLAASTTYTYRVRAVNDGGNSAYSNEANATTLAPPTPPAAPSQLSATAPASDRVALLWKDNSNNEEGFEIERKFGSNAFTLLVRLPANTTGSFDRTVQPSTTYTYRVRAFNNGGNSAYSNEATVTTPARPAPPAAPHTLTVTAVSVSSLRLTWVDASNNEETFEVERRTGSASFTRITTLPANATSYQDSGLAANTLYRYRVRAVNSGGNSAYSNEASGLTLPAAPADLSLTVRSATQLDVSWADTNSNAAAHRVERSVDGAKTFMQVASLPAGQPVFQDTGLLAGTTYQYRVRAANASGFSAYSAVVSGTTQAAVGGKLEVATLLNFGKVRVKKSLSRALTIRNGSANQSLRVLVPALGSPFTLTGGARTLLLQPQQSAALTITFRPTSKRTYSRFLKLRSSDPAKPTVNVKLTGRGK